ncbi:MFS transporter [Oceaniglobus roseus]|uniref:MFS transporter n=1 Tax=Oceaniglobus roseus TaxID=1737570 RepID=UPI000C7F792F|nr:MFS transporter [Kandeliimicrobium roseum]
MHQRYIPEWLRHPPTPGVRGFATLAGIEAVARGILISVYPLAVFKALGDAALVSAVYFAVGLASLASGLLVPWISRFVPRRFVYIFGCLLYATGAFLAIQGSAAALIAGLLCTTAATVTCFVCFNAYVLDYIARADLGKCETSRMFYSALGWTVGPALGVFLLKAWAPAPFLVAAAAALAMATVFLVLRLGNGKLITRSRRPPANPLAYLPRFAAQPRLVAGWLFAVIRSCGWWVYVVYLPIFAIESGLGDRLGGIVLSVTNGTLFLTPLMLRWVQRRSLRRAIRTGFLAAGLLFSGAALAASLPWITVLALLAGSGFLILLDISAGLPFLLAVRPAERTEMSAVYSTFRDVSGIATPAAAWAVLAVAPVAGVFLASGLGLLAAYALAGRLPPRLGQPRRKALRLAAA